MNFALLLQRCRHILPMLEKSVTVLAAVFILLSITAVVQSGLLLVE